MSVRDLFLFAKINLETVGLTKFISDTVSKERTDLSLHFGVCVLVDS